MFGVLNKPPTSLIESTSPHLTTPTDGIIKRKSVNQFNIFMVRHNVDQLANVSTINQEEEDPSEKGNEPINQTNVLADALANEGNIPDAHPKRRKRNADLERMEQAGIRVQFPSDESDSDLFHVEKLVNRL
jgi:hypothetical protein